jgi:hypothetical protein
MAKKKVKKTAKTKSTKKAAVRIEGTFARFAKNSEGEELAWVKPSKGADWQMDPARAKKLGLKKGDPVVGENAHPGKPGRRFLRNVTRRKVQMK